MLADYVKTTYICSTQQLNDNSLPLIPTPPLIMAVNIGAAECRPLPSDPPWLLSWSCLFLTLRVDQESEGCQLCDKLSFKAKTLISHLLASPQEIRNKRNSLSWYKGIKAPTLTSPILSVFTVHLLCSAAGDLEEERRSPTVLVF